MVDKTSDLKESNDLIDSNCEPGMHLSVYGVTVILLDLWIIVQFPTQNRLFTDGFLNYRHYTVERCEYISTSFSVTN